MTNTNYINFNKSNNNNLVNPIQLPSGIFRAGKQYHVQTIDINSLYSELKTAISKRHDFQVQYDNAWTKIKRNNSDHNSEIEFLSKRIGDQTHKINLVINKLCQYKKTHKAMNLAYSYLNEEIRRIEKIIQSTQNKIYSVNSGKAVLISSHGVEHTDTTNLKKYVSQKQNQAAQLRRWRDGVSRFLER